MEKIEVPNNEYIPKKEKNKKSANNILKFLCVIVISFAIGAVLMYSYNKLNPTIITKNRTISETKVSEVAMEDAISKIYDAVLCIEVLNNNGDVVSSGTGFVFEKDEKYGYVLTNAHVVSNGNNIQGKLSNENMSTLTILGMDAYTDLAVLRMDVKDVLSVASIGSSENTKLGNTVFTVGSPMGASYAGTVTKGILSGKNRLIETSTSSNSYNAESFIVKVIQTDAAISPGNSGGPLVNLAGDVIGITSLKLVDTNVEGMGFAIPIEDAINYVDILKQGKAIERPMLGVQILDMTNKYLLYRNNISINSNITEGIILMDVSNNSPASNAGLKDGDIITKINGEKVTTVAKFKYELYKYAIGDTIEITYYRNDKENNTKAKLTMSNN